MTAVGAHVWRGRAGTVLLGPTEHRVAQWLERRTKHGRVIIATSTLAATLGLERSEAYRITRAMRTLGLFGVEDDRGGARGGRRWWRTPTPHDVSHLDDARHRLAWRRLVAWAQWRARRAAARVAQLGHYISGALVTERPAEVIPGRIASSSPAAFPSMSPASEFHRRMLEAGIGPLLETWRRRYQR